MTAFRHEALVYTHATPYAMAVADFVERGVAAGEPTLVAVPAYNIELIRQRLGEKSRELTRFVDMQVAGRNPNRIIPWVLRAFLDEHRGLRCRIVGEPIWPGRAPEEVPIAVQHEALINRAFAGRDATILCPYDASGLSPAVLALAGRTHPLVAVGSGPAQPNATYADPDVVVASLNHPLPGQSIPYDQMTFDLARLGEVRRMVAMHGELAGLTAQQVAALQIAVHEVATNTLEHGGGGGELRIWQQPDRVICEIRGPGHISDWLAGRLMPPEESVRGRGLLVANRLCDLVETHTHPTSTTTRLHMLNNAGPTRPGAWPGRG